MSISEYFILVICFHREVIKIPKQGYPSERQYQDLKQPGSKYQKLILDNLDSNIYYFSNGDQ